MKVTKQEIAEAMTKAIGRLIRENKMDRIVKKTEKFLMREQKELKKM